MGGAATPLLNPALTGRGCAKVIKIAKKGKLSVFFIFLRGKLSDFYLDWLIISKILSTFAQNLQP
jgi:hypothetical protein